nr:MAG TPA: hypothetical protein [Caudoviricetes sp.]
MLFTDCLNRQLENIQSVCFRVWCLFYHLCFQFTVFLPAQR